MKEKASLKRITLMIALMMCYSTSFVFAANAADAVWTNIFDFAGTWLIRLGFGTAFIGGIAFATTFFEDNPDRKLTGLKLIAGGLFLSAVGASPSLFGIV